jgi:hypothetical protein
MVLWNWTVTRKFRSCFGFYLSVVTSLGIKECMCYYHEVTNDGDLKSFEVVYLISNIMSYKQRQYFVYLKSSLRSFLLLEEC